MNQSSDEIREAVRSHYAQIARPATDVEGDPESCCGGADCGCGPASLYDVTLLDELPVDIANLSLGCGDPLTIAQLQPGEVVLELSTEIYIIWRYVSKCFMIAFRVIVCNKSANLLL